MTKNDMDIVSRLRAVLATRVGQQRFRLWFGAGTRLQFEGRTLTVSVPNPFFLDWIRSNFRRDIENACFEQLGHCPTLRFCIDSTASDSSADSEHGCKKNGTDEPDGIQQRGAPRRTRVSRTTGDACANGAQQRKFACLGSFVAGQSRTNRLALASAEMAVQRPGEMTPLLLHGPTGVGKTHLLEGIWSSMRKAHANLTVVYLSAEQFTTYFLEALRGSGLPSFRRKYRGVGLLALDDLQFFVGKRATQIELLHTIDTLLRGGRQLVLTADRSPGELAGLCPELITRIEGGMVCRVDPPDHAARLEIIAQMAGRLKLRVPLEVQQLIASRLTNHARELSGALCRLQATSEALKRPITLRLAEEALADMIRQSDRPVQLPEIERAVCRAFGLEPASLQSSRKAKKISHPRMLAMWLARKHTRAALSEIGQFFGRRSHSTVISAQKRVDRWMADGAALELADQNWNVDEAIRQVERHLRAG